MHLRLLLKDSADNDENRFGLTKTIGSIKTSGIAKILGLDSAMSGSQLPNHRVLYVQPDWELK